MIGDDHHPTPPPSPPIAPAPSPSLGLGLGRRLLGSIRALSSAIAIAPPSTSTSTSTPAASSSSPRLGLSLLLHLKPDLHLLQDPHPPPSTPASLLRLHHDQDHQQGDAAAPTHAPKAKRALHLPQPPTPSPSPSSSLAPPAAAAVEHHQVEPGGLVDEAALHLHTQGAGAGAGAGGHESGPTKGLNVLEQHKGGTRLDLPVPKQGTLLSQDHVAAGDQHRDEDHCMSVVDQHQFEVVDAATCPTPRDAAQEQDELPAHAHAHAHGLGFTQDGNDAVAVEGQEVLEQGVVAGIIGQGTQDATTVAVGDDQEKKPLEQCTSTTSCEEELGTTTMENDGAKDDQEEVEQGAIEQEGAAMDDDNAVKDHEVVGQSVIDHAIIVDDDDQEKKPLEQSSTTYGDLGTTMENAAALVQVQEEVVEQQDATQPRDEDTAAEGQETLEAHQLGSTENADDAVQVQEEGESADATAVDDHDKAVEQCTTADDLGTTMENDVAKDDQEVLEQGVIDQGDASTIDDDRAMDTAAYQGTGDWGLVNKEKVKLPEDDRAMDTAAYQGTGDWGLVSKEKYKLPARRYPQKPRKLNCPSYMSKGTCTYGPSCHFNHPPQLNAKTNDYWRPSERRNHGAAEILELNRLGLPIREGARNCDYYMRTGACRYGKNCHFNHPDHIIDAQFNPPTGWEDNALQMEKCSDHTLDETSRMKKSSDDATLDNRSHMKKSSDDATLDDRSHLKKPSDGAIVDDTSYSKKSSDHDNSSSSGVLPPSIFRMLLPPPKVPPSTEGKAKKKSDWSSDDSDGCCSADSSDGPLCKQGEHVDYPERPGRPEYHHPKQSKDKEEVHYPERPGRADCPFYMRFGDCKFASACNYHHPKDKYPAGRPDEPDCPFLMKRGYCKFGAQCKFYHPEASNPTMQSPTDAKRSVTTDEHHPSTRITLQDYMLPQQPQYPERPGQPECRYYLQFGKCKYLSACIFHHPKDRLAAHSDQIGPEIHGMPDCPFYMKAGKCQFGSACEFRHPKDIHSSSTTEEAFGKRTGSGAYDNLSRSDNGVEQQEESIMYPERPGEPECAHYMRQGYCKFQMNCKYHHPGDRLSKKQY